MAALGPESDLIMPCLPPAYRGPAIVVVVGGTFVVLGAIPVAIAMGLGSRSSATIIGIGFVGFGMLLILPGLCWCIIINHKKNSPWRRRSRLDGGNSGPEATPALRDTSQSQYGGMENEADETTETFKAEVSDSDQVNVTIQTQR